HQPAVVERPSGPRGRRQELGIENDDRKAGGRGDVAAGPLARSLQPVDAGGQHDGPKRDDQSDQDRSAHVAARPRAARVRAAIRPSRRQVSRTSLTSCTKWGDFPEVLSSSAFLSASLRSLCSKMATRLSDWLKTPQ